MELLSPAGNLEKMETAFTYGADAVYMGMKHLSLRAKADNFDPLEAEKIAALKKKFGGRVYCTLNIYCNEADLDLLDNSIEEIRSYPFDAFLVSDMGVVRTLQKHFPDRELHLSTQANCLNSRSAKLYKELGFSRIVLGRETPLADIRRIKDANPDLEIEAFVHGAMCMAYSGRCFLSSHLTGRSANQGDCAHACRWNYSLAIEEKERPGMYMPIAEDGTGMTILSSKDLCMIDHLADLRDAGVDSLKIEGRMKSTYYVATVTRAYRKALDALSDPSINYKPFRNELLNVSHRDYSTGFFYGHGPIDVPSSAGYNGEYSYLGRFIEEVKPGIWTVDVKNQIAAGKKLEYIGPDVLKIEDETYSPLNASFSKVEHIDHCQTCFLKTDKCVKPGYIIRAK